MANIKEIVPKGQESAFLDLIQDATGIYGTAKARKLSESERAESAEKLNKVIGAFMKRPEKKWKEVANNFMTSSDIPVSVTDTASIFRNVGNYDMGWGQAFMDVSLEQGRDFWEIEDMTSGLTFRKVPEGGRIQVEGLAATLAIVRCDSYGGAIGWTDQMIRYRRFPAMQAKAEYFRDELAKDKAKRHYSLMAGTITSGRTTSYDTTGSNALEKDINTINNACYALTARLKDTYVGDPLMQELIMYIEPTLWARISRALRQIGQDVPGQPPRIPFNIRYVPTFNSYLTDTGGNSTTTSALLVLPGYKNQKATAMEPTSYFDFDIQTRTYVQAVWTDYGAAAEGQQIQKVLFA